MKELGSIRELFKQKEIKITPQRIAVYNAMKLLGHANVEEVAKEVGKAFPTITIATIYNVLECLAANKLIAKAMTEGNKMVFDINVDPHCHLFSPKENKIVDFKDPKLMELIWDYMKSKKIENFDISDIKVQFVGSFDK